MSPIEFIAALATPAQKAMVSRGVPASVTIAQGILESAWGKSALATDGFNLFGIKADKNWTGDTLVLPTRECFNGVWSTVQAKWRKYKDWNGSIDDHAAFLRNNPRYAKAFKTKDAESFVKEIAAAGYATDPDYATKIMSVIISRKLKFYDAV